VRRTNIDSKIINKVNEATYHVALGENLIARCEAYGDYDTSVTWREDQMSIKQSI